MDRPPPSIPRGSAIRSARVPADPAIGLGDARSVGTGERRRSAPSIRSASHRRRPQDTQLRFRTEISFRRHHELPRASALPAEAGRSVSQPCLAEPGAGRSGRRRGETASVDETPSVEEQRSVLQARDQLPAQEDGHGGSSRRRRDSLTQPRLPTRPQVHRWPIEARGRRDRRSLETAAAEIDVEVRGRRVGGARRCRRCHVRRAMPRCEAVAETVVRPRRRPFYKREISFRRKKPDGRGRRKCSSSSRPSPVGDTNDTSESRGRAR